MLDFDGQRRVARQLLSDLENGGADPRDSAYQGQQLDPVLLYVIVTYLRRAYPASDPAASGVLERVVGMSSANPEIVQHIKSGQDDPITEWFESDYSYRDFRGRTDEMIEMIMDKLEN